MQPKHNNIMLRLIDIQDLMLLLKGRLFLWILEE